MIHVQEMFEGFVSVISRRVYLSLSLILRTLFLVLLKAVFNFLCWSFSKKAGSCMSF